MSSYINTTQLSQNGVEITPQLRQHITRVMEQVKHDIQSPLLCLSMFCDEQASNSVKKKSKLRVSKTIARINSIINNIQPAIQRINRTSEFVQAILVSESIEKILAEKQYEYVTSDIEFSFNLSDEVRNVSVNTNIDAFERALSNLINNAVEACSNNQNGLVSINLGIEDDMVHLSIEDNGTGMPDEVKNQILNNIAVTANKPNGQGIGFEQIHETLALSDAKLNIESAIGVGTKIKLSFQK